jgi:deoxyribonuclease V
LPSRFEVLGAADIGYLPAGNRLVATVLAFSWPDLELLDSAHAVTPIGFPYIPGLLSFREVPPVIEALRKLAIRPQVILCDGQGIAHPRRFGLASHLGLCLETPTVGCAKKRLCGQHQDLGPHKGCFVPLYLDADPVGCVLRSRGRVKPIYISPGHLSDIESSRHLVERCLGRFRIPEPLRLAHQQATRLRREEAEKGKRAAVLAERAWERGGHE